jgi:putative transcriptional regulator
MIPPMPAVSASTGAVTRSRVPATRGLSQAELAAALGVSRQTVISIESGRYLPSLPLAFTIARFFDLTVDKMFDPDDEETGA